MNKNGKLSKLFIAFLAVVMCITCLCSCSLFSKNRITEIYVVSCTDPDNTLYMKEGSYLSTPRELEKKEAMELVREVEAIPDPVSTDGTFSYIIRISYVEDGVEKSVEKIGYNTFPDNWDRVIELTNTISNKEKPITNSREVAIIDAAYLREHCNNLREGILPEDMTLDDVIAHAPITYLTLYDPTSYEGYSDKVNKAIADYLYEYFDLRSYQIEKLDENPAKSSTDEMKEFADSRLDSVDWDNATEYSCTGSYHDREYEIVRYDMVQLWLEEQSKRSKKCGFDGPYCQYQVEYSGEFAASSGVITKDVFVDGSGKYLVLTDCNKPGDIAAVVK